MKCDGVNCPWKKKYDDLLNKGYKGLVNEIARKNRKILEIRMQNEELRKSI